MKLASTGLILGLALVLMMPIVTRSTLFIRIKKLVLVEKALVDLLA